MIEKVTPPSGLTPGGGAQFWGYVSGQNRTPEIVTRFVITLQHKTSNWTGQITSHGEIVGTPELSGDFSVSVTASGPNLAEKKLELLLDPSIPHNPDVSCCIDGYGMIGIVATEDGKDAKYWTVSYAL